MIAYEIAQISRGELYEKPLGGIDRTTLIELAILALWGVLALRARSDLEAVSFTLVSGLSFIFVYEAVYKWSFYLSPFRLDMPSSELRQLVIQLGTGLTVLTGFATRLFRLTRWTIVWAGAFVLLWILWLLAGFPQITGKVVWPASLPIPLSLSEIYLINRFTKGVLWLAYLTLFPRLWNGTLNQRSRSRSQIGAD